MKRSILVVLAALHSLSATTHIIQTASCGATPACYSGLTKANFETAFAALACGDTLTIEPNITAGNGITLNGDSDLLNLAKACASDPVTITTTAAAWLPSTHARVTPSYRNVLPQFRLNAAIGNDAQFRFVTHGDGGVIFRGLAFLMTNNYIIDTGNPFSYLMYFGDPNLANTGTTADFFQNVTLDRNLVYDPWHAGITKGLVKPFFFLVKDAITATGNWLNIPGINRSHGAEGQVWDLSHGGGDPVTITRNTYTSGTGEVFMSGGNDSPYASPGALTQNVLYENNISIFRKDWQPNGANASVAPIMKNGFELKQGVNVVVRRNTIMNQWSEDGSQWWAVKLSIYNQSSTPGCSPSTILAGLSAGNTRVTLSADPAYPAPQVGQVIGLPATSSSPTCAQDAGGFVGPDWVWRTITNRVSATVFDVSPAYSGVFGGATTNLKFAFAFSPAWKLNNVTVEGNLFRNTASGIAFEGNEPSLCCGTSQIDTTIRNNLHLIDSSTMNTTGRSLQMAFLNIGRGGTRLNVINNTSVTRDAAHSTVRELNSGLNGVTNTSAVYPWNAMRALSNIFPRSSFGGPSGAQIDTYSNSDAIWSRNSYKGTDFNSNGANPYGVDSGCASNTCTHLIPGKQGSGSTSTEDLFRAPDRNDYRVNPKRVAVCGVSSNNPLTLVTCTPHSFGVGDAVAFAALGGITITKTLCGTGTPATDCWNGINYVSAVADSTHIALKNAYVENLTASGTWTSGGWVQAAQASGSHIGADVGADMSQVPLLQNVHAECMSQACIIYYTVPSSMAGEVGQIEVVARSSPATPTGLLTDAADYTPVSAVNPAFYYRADHDSCPEGCTYSAYATIAPGGVRRSFQVGALTSTTGDDGISHTRALAASTVHDYRILLGGAVETGTFTTAASDSGATAYSVKARATRGTHIRVRYGLVASSLTTASEVACASGCTLSIPATSGHQLLYYLDETNGGGTLVYSAPVTVAPVR